MLLLNKNNAQVIFNHDKKDRPTNGRIQITSVQFVPMRIGHTARGDIDRFLKNCIPVPVTKFCMRRVQYACYVIQCVCDEC